MNIYHVYIYWSPKTNLPFYVGYGKGNRHLYHLTEARRSLNPKQGQHKLNTIRNLLSENLEPIIQIVDDHLTKEEACELEVFLIAMIGRRDKNTGPLTNQTKGGDGTRDWSDAARKAMGNRNRGAIAAKDVITGVGCRVSADDPRWISGELVGVNKNKPAHPNTISAARAKKGVPKPAGHGDKVSAAMSQLKWYCNFSTNVVGRFKDNEMPPGFVRVSGPHKRTVI